MSPSANRESALNASALAGVYARYDSLRVIDITARPAEDMVRIKYMSALTDAEQTSFLGKLKETAESKEKLEAVCANVRRLGAPTYHPTYMTQHGMAALLIGDPNDGLIPNYDSAHAWSSALTEFLHCTPKA